MKAKIDKKNYKFFNGICYYLFIGKYKGTKSNFIKKLRKNNRLVRVISNKIYIRKKLEIRKINFYYHKESSHPYSLVIYFDYFGKGFSQNKGIPQIKQNYKRFMKNPLDRYYDDMFKTKKQRQTVLNMIKENF